MAPAGVTSCDNFPPIGALNEITVQIVDENERFENISKCTKVICSKMRLMRIWDPVMANFKVKTTDLIPLP